MKILFLSWKDIKHPQVGGAEVVLRNYIKRLKEKGYNITWIGSNFKGGKHKDNIDGVDIIRIGTINSIYFKFPKYYKNNLKGIFDLIIDEAGGMPLFSPLYERQIPIIFFVHHIGDIEWDFKYPFPFNKIGKYLFKKVIGLYKDKHTITISNSTKDELVQRLGFRQEKIHVIENALDLDYNHTIDIFDKKNEILFLARLTPMKRAEHAILAFDYFNKKNNNYILNIIGPYQDGKYLEILKQLIKKLKLENKVFLRGGISLEERYKIAKNKVLLIPSHKEGYGLVILEGNVYGIPAIGYDVAGIKDSIKQGINGFKVSNANYKAMGEKLYEILSSEKKYKKLVESSYKHIKNHTTREKNTKIFEEIILQSHLKNK